MVSMACSVLNGQTPASAAPTCPAMEVSIVADTPGESARSISAGQGRLIPLAEKPLLTFDDFTDASVSLTEGQVVLNVSMTTESAKRVQDFTAHNVGKTIAFLVNGRVINTPRILDPITGKGFLIGPFSRDEAQKLADSINHRDGSCAPQGRN